MSFTFQAKNDEQSSSLHLLFRVSVPFFVKDIDYSFQDSIPTEDGGKVIDPALSMQTMYALEICRVLERNAENSPDSLMNNIFTQFESVFSWSESIATKLKILMHKFSFVDDSLLQSSLTDQQNEVRS